jgi:hypothetical protein
MFNNIVSTAEGYRIAWDAKMIVNGECVKICNESVVSLFKVLSWHSPGGSEENHENVVEDSQ